MYILTALDKDKGIKLEINVHRNYPIIFILLKVSNAAVALKNDIYGVDGNVYEKKAYSGTYRTQLCKFIAILKPKALLHKFESRVHPCINGANSKEWIDICKDRPWSLNSNNPAKHVPPKHREYIIKTFFFKA